jgi:CheY-like chemotaxis protein
MSDDFRKEGELEIAVTPSYSSLSRMAFALRPPVQEEGGDRPSNHMPNAKTHCPFILVIDDEPLVAGVIADTLMLVGYKVETAKNGREGLEKIAACAYDLILSDLRMPELDGVGLYRELEQHHPSVLRRLAFVSGTTEPPEYASFLERTGATVLGKPFALAHLQRLVQRILQDQQ